MINSYSQYKFPISFLFFVFFIQSASAWACEDELRTETMSIAHEAMHANYQVSQTKHFQGVFSKMGELDKRVESLPSSCQSLYGQIMSDFEHVYAPNTTQCIGGICCGYRGCL